MELLAVLSLAALVLGLLALLKSSKSGQRGDKSNRLRPKSLKPKIRPQSFEPFSGKAHVIDGDTIKVRGLKVRLAGINAPELDMPYGQKAKWEMVNICKGKTVRVVPNGETSYDRIVATCYVNGDTDIGAELIKRGLARDIPIFTGGKYKNLETPAARRRIKPIPYKKKHDQEKPTVEAAQKPEDEISLVDDDDFQDFNSTDTKPTKS